MCEIVSSSEPFFTGGVDSILINDDAYLVVCALKEVAEVVEEIEGAGGQFFGAEGESVMPRADDGDVD